MQSYKVTVLVVKSVTSIFIETSTISFVHYISLLYTDLKPRISHLDLKLKHTHIQAFILELIVKS